MSYFQTKELISEIELLEEEVANREQHVLSLYRTIFDNCVSRPPSEQNSVMTSPAHTKHGTRKHPSIISSAFCSSKKFPLRPLQALVSIDDPWKKFSKRSHPPPSSGKSKNMDFEKTCFDPVKVWYILISLFVLQIYFLFFFFYLPWLKSLLLSLSKKDLALLHELNFQMFGFAWHMIILFIAVDVENIYQGSL